VFAGRGAEGTIKTFSYIHRHTQAHTDTHIPCTYAQAHERTDTQKHRHTDTLKTLTHRKINTQTRRHTETPTKRHRDQRTHT